MKALITGAGGFVGAYLRNELEHAGYEVACTDIIDREDIIKTDVLHSDEIRSLIEHVAPNVVFHLAAQASPALSWEIPQKTIAINVIGAINIMEALRGSDVRLLLVGSSDQYGKAVATTEALSEETPLNPRTPYAISKKAQEDLAKTYAQAYNLAVFCTRSFNHCGPGQRTGYLVSDLCAGVVAAERGERSSIGVGNLDAIRDFTDVRDVVRAYRLIAERGIPGEIYNVGSGVSRSAKSILEGVLKLSDTEISIIVDPTKLRTLDIPAVYCNNHKLVNHIGWVPEIPFETTLLDTLNKHRALSGSKEADA